MLISRDDLFEQFSRKLNCSFDGEILSGGNYALANQHGREVYVSGQIPRVGSTVVSTGRVGVSVSLPDARFAAQICVMRALAILRKTLGSLDAVETILRMTVYVQCGPDFTQHSEVADGASEVLYFVFGPDSKHTRTSVGVYQLPKNASIEIDLIAATSHT